GVRLQLQLQPAGLPDGPAHHPEHRCAGRVLMARFRSSLTLAALLSLGAAALFPGCGPELDRISELKTLRILGVKKSAPYARPGESVELEMFWEDVGPGAPRPVTRFIGF